MDTAKTSLFPLPSSQVVETLYVRLADGSIVPRTPAEVQKMMDYGEDIFVLGPATR